MDRQSAPGQRLTVLSWNLYLLYLIHPFKRLQSQCRLIREQSPDIAMLQEVHFWLHFWRLSRLVSEQYPYICYYRYPWYSWKNLLGPAGGLVTLSRQPLKVRAYLPLRRTNPTDPRGGWHKAILVCETPDGRLATLNAQLNPADINELRIFRPFRTTRRRRLGFQLDQVAAVAQALVQAGRVVVLGADLNLPYGWPEHTKLVGGATAVPMPPSDKLAPTCRAMCTGELHTIDYVLAWATPGRVRLETYQVLPTGWTGFWGRGGESDHRPITARYRLCE